MNLLKVSQFCISQGVVRERGPSLASFFEDGVYLYFVVESIPAGDGDTCRAVINAAERSFRGQRASVTRRLRQAVTEAHRELRVLNQRRLPSRRHSVAITCLAVAGNHAYLAQAGPGRAYTFSPQDWEVVVPGDDDPYQATPLGGDAEPQVWLHHYHLRPGHRLLITTSAMERVASPRDIDLLHHMEAEEIFRSLFIMAREEREFAAIYVETTTPTTEAAAPSPPSPPTSLTPGRLSRGWHIFLPALALVLGIIAFDMGLGYFQQWGEGRAREEFASKLSRAQEAHQAALAAPDRSQARRLLQQAVQLLEEALSTHRNDDLVTARRRQVAAALAQLDAVVEARDSKLLFDFAQMAPNSRLGGLVVAEGQTFVLDQGAGRVYQLTPARQADLILGPNQEGGLPSFGLPRRILWMPAGPQRRQGSLLIFDEERNLAEYIPGGGLRQLTLRGAVEWSSFADAWGYEGNLYILDPKAHQVWRYQPTDSGFDSERRGRLDGVRLDGAQAMAIDGNVYILADSARLSRVVPPPVLDFSMEGLDDPPTTATQVFATQDMTKVYLLEPPKRRILVFSKDGRFERQLAIPLAGVAGVVVDESERGILAIEGSRLHQITLP